MVKNIINKRVDSFFVAKDFFHLAKFVLALFDYFFISIVSKGTVFCINLSKNLIIKLKFDNAAFVINRARCTIKNRLSHIVNINVIAKYFDGAAIFAGNWSTCKTDIVCVRKTVADNAGGTSYGFYNRVSFFI